MGKHLTPFQVCEQLIGPPAILGGICGLNGKSPYLWARPSKWRAAGDIPGGPLQRALLNYSEKHDLGLTAEHLIRGAEEAEINAILAARGAGKVAAE